VRRRILNSRTGHPIGYVEGEAAFDFSGKLRCRYDGKSGNLRDPETEKVVGHVSLDGNFVGRSWDRDQLFPPNLVAAAQVDLPEPSARPEPYRLQANTSVIRHDADIELAIERLGETLKVRGSKANEQLPAPSQVAHIDGNSDAPLPETDAGQKQDTGHDNPSDDPDIERALSMIRETLKTK